MSFRNNGVHAQDLHGVTTRKATICTPTGVKKKIKISLSKGTLWLGMTIAGTTTLQSLNSRPATGLDFSQCNASGAKGQDVVCFVCFWRDSSPPPLPSGPGPPHSRGFQITHNDAPQSVGLLWTSDQLVAKTST